MNEAIEVLRSIKGEIQVTGKLTSLHEAVRRNDKDEIDRLLAEGVPINGKLDGETCLDVVDVGNATLMFHLLDKGAYTVHLPTEIIAAIKEDKTDEVNTMLSENTDLVNAKDPCGNTLLHLAAAQESNKPMIKMLKKHGIPKAAENQYGETYKQVAESKQETSNAESTASTSAPRR